MTSCAEIPDAISAICLKCLRKKPAERYGSAQEIVTAREAWKRLISGLCATGSASDLRNSCLDRSATKNTGKASGTLNSSSDNALEAWKPTDESRDKSPSENRFNDRRALSRNAGDAARLALPWVRCSWRWPCCWC